MSSRDYPKLLTPEVQEAIRDHDLAEAVRLYEVLLEQGASLALWAELLDELAARGHSWREWVELSPRGESGLEQAVYFLVLGIEALQEEAYERASYFLNRCVELAPDSPVPLAYIGILYESQGCPTEALATYERCLSLDPALFSVLNAAGNLYHELGFYERAIAHYRRAFPLLHEACNQAILLDNLGNSLRALGRHDEAIAAYTEAIALDPSQPASPIALAETFFEVHRHVNVITCLSDLLQMPAFDAWSDETQRAVYDLLARAYRQVRTYPASLMFQWLRNGARLDEEDREGVSRLLKTLFGWAIDEPGQ
ncbi:MAG TPA: tetratricopeptide repeat protein, partial [Oscillatoriaceae cyanobacterium]